MMTVCIFPIHQIISLWTFWSLKVWQFMAKMRMLQNNIAKSFDSFFFFFHEFEISKFWMGSLFNQVSAALSKEALKESKLLFGIDFTRSNEWTGLFHYVNLFFLIFHSLMYDLLMEQKLGSPVCNCTYKTLGCNLTFTKNNYYVSHYLLE